MRTRWNLSEHTTGDVEQALPQLDRMTADCGLPHLTRALVHLRVSQIKGCGVCIDLHLLKLLETGETENRILALDAWRGSTCFSGAERAALALAEDVTGVGGRTQAASDAAWAEARRLYGGPVLAALVLQIAKINAVHGLETAVMRRSLQAQT